MVQIGWFSEKFGYRIGCTVPKDDLPPEELKDLGEKLVRTQIALDSMIEKDVTMQNEIKTPRHTKFQVLS